MSDKFVHVCIMGEMFDIGVCIMGVVFDIGVVAQTWRQEDQLKARS